MTSICISYIVIYKFHYKQMFYLVILLLIDKSPKLGLYYIVLSFDLAICLKIEGDRELLLDTKEII